MEETGGSSVEGWRTQEGLVWRNGEDRREQCRGTEDTGGASVEGWRRQEGVVWSVEEGVL